MERSQDWLDEAEGDLEHARHDLRGKYYNWACFSAQQGAEKALKAVFQKLGAEAWGHSVAELLAELAKKFRLPSRLMETTRELDKAYIPTRYPNVHPSGSPRRLYTANEAKRMIEHAEKVIVFCKGVLSQI